MHGRTDLPSGRAAPLPCRPLGTGSRAPPSGTMKAAKQQGNAGHGGESQPALSPLRAALGAAAASAQAYETYIDNGLICLKHKIRNIEKKKLKLEDYKDRLKNGEPLNSDQLEAVEKYEEVSHNLEFAKELQRTFSGLSQDLLKAQRKAQRREHVLQLEAEKKKLRTVLQVQYVLQNLSREHVQEDFRGGFNGALSLPSRELERLVQFAKLTCPERNASVSVEEQMEQSSLYFWDLLEGSEKAVLGTTYKHMKDLLSQLLMSGYFESVPEPKGAPEEAVPAEPGKERLSRADSVQDSESLMECTQPEIQPQEFLNRRYLSEVEAPSQTPEARRPWEAGYARRPPPSRCWPTLGDAEGQERPEPLLAWDSGKPQAPPEPASAPARRESPEEQKTPEASPAWEPDGRGEPRKPWAAPLPDEPEPESRPTQPWAPRAPSQRQAAGAWPVPGREGREPEPWGAGARSPPRALLQRLHSPPEAWGPPEPREGPELPSEAAGVPPGLPRDPALRKEKLQDLMTQIQGTYHFMQDSLLDFDKPSSAAPSPQLPSVLPDSPEASVEQKLPDQSDFLPEPSQAAIPPSKQRPSLPSANPPMSQASEEQVFQSPPASSSTVFHVNAPLPPRTEQEIKDSPYSEGYNQSFTTASTQTPPQCQLPSLHVEQTTLPQEQMANCQPAGTIQVSSGSPAFYPAQTNAFPRSTQSYLSNRGSIRGCARGGRSLPNSFRSSAGYKGFDSYRGSLVIANGSYGQLQFQAREYPGTPYSQRDSSLQPCYRRGGIGAASRTGSRGWSSPERESEPAGSVDSGRGDSRSLTPVDVASPAAAILPVHVYPLPQQMRVAFSAARTSNLAPGTLDQPIVFDLLLNNLGETFDLQLGRFTCPVNGTYVFIFHMLKLAVNVPLYVNLMKNEEVLVSAYANDGAPDHETASNHAILQLFQGDQIWLRLHRGAVYGSSWKYSTFSGYLLYQD
ncbi:caprin-2 isoform X3 [Monodelphis domestica]|uniref:caprin-2 isoform X3 n=1 Tax=Monodelphis domestica TaxID=13616 RepID=UPI0024E241FC|nr:caprin-2 isoform X3 [Monodelphis domestica]